MYYYTTLNPQVSANTGTVVIVLLNRNFSSKRTKHLMIPVSQMGEFAAFLYLLL